MAFSENAGFPAGLGGGAALSTELGAAISAQFARMISRFGRGDAQPNVDQLSGPGLGDLEPGLAGELSLARRF